MLKLTSITYAALLSISPLAFAQQTPEIMTRELAVDGTTAVTVPRAAAGAQGRAFTPTAPGLTRAEVQAELARARASGEIERYQALYSGGGN
jgi:hypothetical protein